MSRAIDHLAQLRTRHAEALAKATEANTARDFGLAETLQRQAITIGAEMSLFEQLNGPQLAREERNEDEAAEAEAEASAPRLRIVANPHRFGTVAHALHTQLHSVEQYETTPPPEAA